MIKFNHYENELKMKRHTCIICKRKRYEHNMEKVLDNSWVCTDKYDFKYCCDNKEIRKAEFIKKELDSFKFITIQHIINRA